MIVQLTAVQEAEIMAKARRAGLEEDINAAVWAAIQAWKPEPQPPKPPADTGRRRVFVKG